MTLIKKKPEWKKYKRPVEPSKPIEPKEYLEVDHEQIIVNDSVLSGVTEYQLKDLELPKNITLSDLTLVIEQDHDGNIYSDFESPCYNVRIVFRQKRASRNPRYEKQLEKYKSDMIIYEKKMRTHKEDVEQWKLWVEQDKRLTLEAELTKARKLLEKHGKL